MSKKKSSKRALPMRRKIGVGSNKPSDLAQIQVELRRAQEELAKLTATGSAGGGVVQVVATGERRVSEIRIDPEVVNPEEVDMLEDLLVAAVNQALDAVEAQAAQLMGSIMGLPPEAVS